MRLIVVLATFLLVLAACAAPASPADGARTAATASPATAATSLLATVPAARPLYLTIALTDVRSGETFRLGGFPGQTVIVEGMAVW